MVRTQGASDLQVSRGLKCIGVSWQVLAHSPDVPNDGVSGFLLPEELQEEAAYMAGVSLQLLLLQDIQHCQTHSAGHRAAPKLRWDREVSVLGSK